MKSEKKWVQWKNNNNARTLYSIQKSCTHKPVSFDVQLEAPYDRSLGHCVKCDYLIVYNATYIRLYIQTVEEKKMWAVCRYCALNSDQWVNDTTWAYTNGTFYT